MAGVEGPGSSHIDLPPCPNLNLLEGLQYLGFIWDFLLQK